MAIIDKFEVKVHVDGKPAKEYDAQDSSTSDLKVGDPPGVITKYVEAISGASFGVELKICAQKKHQCDYLSWQLRLDGKLVRSERVEKSDYSFRNGIESFMGGAITDDGKETYRRFTFATLETRESEIGEILDEKTLRKYSELGTLTIEIWRKNFCSPKRQPVEMTAIGQNPHSSLRSAQLEQPDFRTSGTEAIPEKVLKGRSISVSTGFNNRPSASKRSVSTSYIGRTKYLDKKPLAKFILSTARNAERVETKPKQEREQGVKRVAKPSGLENARSSKVLKTEASELIELED
ncbi:MAG: hypothetical protein Q9160_008019 [Pyrenula sp. 1 TL-2023]